MADGTELPPGSRAAVVLSGHGAWHPRDGSVPVPDGVTLSFYCGHGLPLADAVGATIDAMSPRRPRVHEVRGAGEWVPNYRLRRPAKLTLGPPAQRAKNLVIASQRATPGYEPVNALAGHCTLAELFAVADGMRQGQSIDLHWAACRVDVRDGRCWPPGMRTDDEASADEASDDEDDSRPLLPPPWLRDRSWGEASNGRRDELGASSHEARAVDQQAASSSLDFSWHQDQIAPRAYSDVEDDDDHFPPPRAAFIINAMFSYREVDDIDRVLAAMLAGLEMDRGRVAIVLGINAPETEREALAAAVERVRQRIVGRAVAVVPATFSGSFPFGTMRNQVLQSDATQAFTRRFADEGFAPYVSIQDFDTGSRLAGRSGRHIFDVLDETVRRGDRPLMFGGGYRAGADLAARTLQRLPDAEMTQEIADDLAAFNEHVAEDMDVRQTFANVHPLLPYTPEPNLFLDAEAVANGGRDGRPLIRFGAGAAEYTQLAKSLADYERAELEAYYRPRYEAAPERAPVPPFRVYDPNFVIVEDRAAIRAQLEADVQNNRHPQRGVSYDVDFTRTVETDLSRLAQSWVSKGKDPQSHVGFAVADRFFDTKGAKKDTSLAGAADKLRRYLGPEDDDGLDPTAQDQRFFRLTGSMQDSLSDDERRRRRDLQKSLPFRQRNQMSSALSTPFSGAFDGISTGIQPGQKEFTFAAIADAQRRARARAKFRAQQEEARRTRLAHTLSRLMSPEARGTPVDGNCLYHAVIQQLVGAVDDVGAAELRRRTAEYVFANLGAVSAWAHDNGVSVDDLILTISTTGNWNGQQGDLVPQLVASALGRPLHIVQHYEDGGSQVHTLHPLNAAPQPAVQVHLKHQHYSVAAPAPPELRRRPSRLPSSAGSPSFRRSSSSRSESRERDRGRRRSRSKSRSPSRSRSRSRSPRRRD